MSRSTILLLHPAIVAVVCVIGFALCRVMGFDPHLAPMWMAGVINLAAAELAMVPILFVRGKTADNVAPACLMATVIHMLAAGGGSVAVMQLSHPPKAFSLWLCAFYAMTLVGVCRVLLQAMKSAPVPTQGESIHLRQASET